MRNATEWFDHLGGIVIIAASLVTIASEGIFGDLFEALSQYPIAFLIVVFIAVIIGFVIGRYTSAVPSKHAVTRAVCMNLSKRNKAIVLECLENGCAKLCDDDCDAAALVNLGILCKPDEYSSIAPISFHLAPDRIKIIQRNRERWLGNMSDTERKMRLTCGNLTQYRP